MPIELKREINDYELSRLESDARFKVICTRCYGVGQVHFAKPLDHWAVCEVCKGNGKSEREPHVLRLVTELKMLLGVIDAINQRQEQARSEGEQ